MTRIANAASKQKGDVRQIPFPTPFMGFRPPRLSTVSLIALGTAALFAIAALFPNDAIDLVAWLAAALLGLPLCVLSYRDARASAVPLRWFTPPIRLFLLRLFGTVSLSLAVWALGWLAYCTFLGPLQSLSTGQSLAQAVLPVALIGCAYRLLAGAAVTTRTIAETA
ncbi:MAG: hypothetical protein U0132_13345 [Gemmatimonadaceae bacterium]